MRYYADIRESLIHATGSSICAHRVIHFAIEEVHPNIGMYLTDIPPDEVTNLVDPVDHLIFIKQRNFSIQISIAQSHSEKRKYNKCRRY